MNTKLLFFSSLYLLSYTILAVPPDYVPTEWTVPEELEGQEYTLLGEESEKIIVSMTNPVFKRIYNQAKDAANGYLPVNILKIVTKNNMDLLKILHVHYRNYWASAALGNLEINLASEKEAEAATIKEGSMHRTRGIFLLEEALRLGSTEGADVYLNLAMARANVSEGKYCNLKNFQRALEVADIYRTLCLEEENHPDNKTAPVYYYSACRQIFQNAFKAGFGDWVTTLHQQHGPIESHIIVSIPQDRSEAIAAASMKALVLALASKQARLHVLYPSIY